MKRLIRWRLVIYDLLIYAFSCFFVLVVYPNNINNLTLWQTFGHAAVGCAALLAVRMIFRVYEQIWRYAGSKEYIRLIISDGIACVAFLLLRGIFSRSLTLVRGVSLFTLNLLACIMARQIYQGIYQNRGSGSEAEKRALRMLKVIGGISFSEERPTTNKIRIAIIGAGAASAKGAESNRSWKMPSPSV